MFFYIIGFYENHRQTWVFTMAKVFTKKSLEDAIQRSITDYHGLEDRE